jgi:RNA polymerase sigma factor (sigma-70 family)
MASLKSGTVLRSIYDLFEKGSCISSSDAQLLDRFVNCRDQTAFEALVIRHGRTVQAVCLAVLHDQHDAEDAFQATFLILARKAGSLWVGDSLAAWLHRVARRVAVEANRQRTRRRAIEKTGLELDTARTESPVTREILAQLLHEEIDRLPEKYRVPIVLCDLERLTRDEAAHRLGWPPGTVAGRLARARVLLRDRLARRGHDEASGSVALAGFQRATSGGVPAAWIKKTVQLVTLSHVDTIGASNLAAAGVWVLTRGVLRAMTVTGLRKVTLLLAAGALAMTACAVAVATVQSEPSHPAGPAVVAAAGRSQTPVARLAASGTLVLPDGKPAAGVRMFYSTRDHASDHGHVRAEARADDLGRFSLELPPVDAAWLGMVGSGTLWAYRPGSYVATMPVYRGALPAGLPLRMVVGPSARALFEVRDPDGKPVAGARIEPMGLERYNAHVPDRLAELIGAETVTDAQGRAVMAAFFQEEVLSIAVVAEGYGRQTFCFGFQDISPDPKIVRLQPVGRLKGRLVGDPQATRRCPLRIAGFAPPDSPVRFSYSDYITTDDDGRFDLPAIAAGSHVVRTVERCDWPWRARLEQGLVDVKPGQTTEVVLTIKPAVKVHGVVREKGTRKAIAGVRMAVAIFETGAMTTGEDGMYHGFIPTDPTLVSTRAVPPGYATPLYGVGQVRVPEDGTELTLPPLELLPAGEVRGKVVRERAQPAVGAEVEASWNVDENRVGTGPHRLTVRTGPDGRFVIPGVPQGAKVDLSARHRGLHTREPRSTSVGDTVILHLTESSGVTLGGQVLDQAGRAIAGASVHLRSRRKSFTAGAIEDVPVTFEHEAVLTADAEGRFRTPRELDPNDEYAAFASAPGYVASRTVWTLGIAGSFPDMKLQPQTGAAWH